MSRPSKYASPVVASCSAHQREAHGRLAGARFADEAQRLAARQPERHVPDRRVVAVPEEAVPRAEDLAEVADLEDDRVAGGDAAAALRVEARVARGRRRTEEVVDDGQPQRPAVESRPALQQRLRVGVPRRLEHLGGRPLLADLPVAHHDDPVGDLADDGEVVGDEQHRHRVPLLQRGDELEDLLLDRDVERGRRLVGDQQLGLAGDRHRDHHPLLLAARQLRRKGVDPEPGIGNAHFVEELDRAPSRLRGE